eukprot:TRINITY_DN250_c2_g1_i1.p1 TRINITY_DN250_c2_g1~~TRINITY_DN250_c2_g1_i1.p1  ORF type:complete len:213 (+),score=59.90 TRINITY_DN250_c2_g1_i1:52-639(+)
MGGKGFDKGRQKGVGGRKGSKGTRMPMTKRSENCPRLLRLWYGEEEFPDVSNFNEEGWEEERQLGFYYWQDTTFQELATKLHNCETIQQLREKKDDSPVSYSFGVITKNMAGKEAPLFRLVQTSPTITFPLNPDVIDVSRPVSSTMRSALHMFCKIHIPGKSPTKHSNTEPTEQQQQQQQQQQEQQQEQQQQQQQ